MDDEEKLLGMMAIIEEQQEAIKHQAQSTAASHTHLQQQWLQQQDHLAKKHGEVISQYGGLFKKHLAELTERSNRWLDWKMLVASVATIGGSCLLVLAGATFYLSYLVGEMTAAESELSGIEENIKQLKAFNLDWRPCEVKGEQQICVRVMASWGGQGTHKDYFVIDPK